MNLVNALFGDEVDRIECASCERTLLEENTLGTTKKKCPRCGAMNKITNEIEKKRTVEVVE